MIFVTGDVHSKSLEHWEQKIAGSEILAAEKFLEILKKYEIKSTLFLNGESFENEFEDIKKLFQYDVEIGGHTYDNFGKMNIFRSYLNRRRFGCVYGSEKYQKNDIEKTKKAFEKFGIDLKSWRTHAFASNEKTFELLRENGIKFVSDLTGNEKPFERNGVIHVSINIPVDQNTISYGKLTPENRDPFVGCVKGRIKPEEWFDILKKRVLENERNKIDSVILIHPITMKILDDFKMFDEIAKFLSKYKSGKLSEIKIS